MLVSRLLASDFPTENPRTQTRNFPYTKRWQQFTSINIKNSINGKNLDNNNSDNNFFNNKFSLL
jgi:hypothetical protein